MLDLPLMAIDIPLAVLDRPFDLLLVVVLQTRVPGRGVENRKSPKVVRRGCKRSFGPRERKASCTGATWGLHRCKTGLHMVQETLGRPLLPRSKRPFAPSPNHFRGFSYFWPLSQALWFAMVVDLPLLLRSAFPSIFWLFLMTLRVIYF